MKLTCCTRTFSIHKDCFALSAESFYITAKLCHANFSLMRILIFTCALLLTCTGETKAQSDSSLLFSEVITKLENHSASVSTILSDKKYLSLHPQTSFRELVKKHSNDSTLIITTAGEPGKKIKVTGIVKDEAGQPVAGALVYLYQTDSRGWYAADAPHVGGNEGDIRHARLFGYVKTDQKGRFELHTIKPSGYPRSDLPAHIHIHFQADGYEPYGTEFLFDDDERLVGDIREQSVRNRFLISKPEKTAGPFEQQFSYSVMMRRR